MSWPETIEGPEVKWKIEKRPELQWHWHDEFRWFPHQ